MLKNNPTFIIAEAGVNHNGDIEIAKELIRAAAEAGADAVKFQTFRADNLVSRSAPKAEYQKKNTNEFESQYQMIKLLELDFEAHLELIEYCRKKDIVFLSSPFDLDSIRMLDQLGLQIYKIPSGEITNLPYLKAIGRLRKQVILSSGMSSLQEIKEALQILISNGTKLDLITVLQCNTEYPTPFGDVNLKAMHTIQKQCNVKIGYSDHTIGTIVPIAAVSMGARIIEKHFTIDKKLKGPDHKASLEPNELRAMIQSIRIVETAFGSGIKEPSHSEMKNISIVRKSIVAKRAIKKGELFSDDNLTTKRPGNGISPMEWSEVIGKHAKKDFSQDDLIEV